MIVLLDQNDWISIARAEYAPRKATAFDRRLLELVEDLRSAGTRFPLSLARYHETINTRKTKHRRDVAMSMERFSGYESLLAPGPCIDIQIETLLAQRFGITPPPDVPLFGYGWAQALGVRGLRVSGPDATLALQMEEILQAIAPEIMPPFEFGALSGEPVDSAHEVALDQLRQFVAPLRQNFEADERRSEDLLRQYAGRDPAELRRLARGQSFSFYLDRLLSACDQHGLDAELVIDELTDPSIAVIDDLPCIEILASLREQKARNPARSWTANDYYDVITLQHGLPYCDIVSADKFWTDLADRAGLPNRYRATVAGKPDSLIVALEQLGDRIDAAGASA